jgi:preprotein translocase SecA subunit
VLGFIKKVVGTKNERELRRVRPLVEAVNAIEDRYRSLSDAALKEKTEEFKGVLRAKTAQAREEAVQAGAEVGAADAEAEDDRKREAEEREKALRESEAEALKDILPEAFAAVREASRRTIGLRHFDVQLIGGMVLHEGKIAEMKTGEGKTLVATLPLYLNSLTGRGAHLVTVNDYLARRDVQWMGPIYHALGLSVATIVHDTSYLFDPAYVTQDYRQLHLRPIPRKEAYLADVTYGTNHEFGFDYLRDNMKFSIEDYVQRELNYAIVDEVDNILIDEARTPLIISGPAEESTEKYYAIDRIIPKLQRGAVIQGDPTQEKRAEIEAQGDYTVDEKSRTVTLTETGVAKVERLLGIHNLYDPRHIDILHHVQQGLRAHALFRRDVDYVVKDGEVIIVDEFTGRLMPGRRWSDGLHQAIEAREGLRIREENQTLATITIQNYFRMYKKLGGMTGTADTEATEFKKIYNLEVMVVPTHREMIRDDRADVVYRSEREKFDAVVEEIAACHEKGQPVLVGTTSVAKSERLSRLLKKKGVKHNVLNAVNHEAEASIIAQAGRYGTVTIATNMAGRGTDILLGGNPDFLARADMENEWISRATKSPSQGAKRYEEALRELKEKYDEEVQRIESSYRKEVEPHERQRAESLRRATEIQKRLVENSPFAALKQDYERSSATELIEAMHESRAIPESYFAVKERLVGALLGHPGSGGSAEREEFVAAHAAFSELLERWQADGEKKGGLMEALDDGRRVYEQKMSDYEFALAKHSFPDGEEASLAAEYDQARRLFDEAEARCEALRDPYEEALRRAHRDYEAKRQEYVRFVEEIREQFEKAPDEHRQRYGEILEKYRKTCADERTKVIDAGGLHIIGTERHESRRIDNQLRGRSGRQGDPGSSRFYLSLEDDLMRIFGAERIQGIMNRLGMEEGVPIEHGLVSRAIENAQKKVEAHNFDIRKHLLEYDDVLNKQREVIYHQRRDVLRGEDLKTVVLDMAADLAAEVAERYLSDDEPSSGWDMRGLGEALYHQFSSRLEISAAEVEAAGVESFRKNLVDRILELYEQKERRCGAPVLRQLEKIILLQTIDGLWKDHLLSMDHLKEGIGLRGYGQKNPLQEYQKEGYAMFQEMVRRIQEDAVQKLFAVEIAHESTVEQMALERRPQRVVLTHGGGEMQVQPAKRQGAKVGRNDPCPCGSSKKYKRCCGK